MFKVPPYPVCVQCVRNMCAICKARLLTAVCSCPTWSQSNSRDQCQRYWANTKAGYEMHKFVQPSVAGKGSIICVEKDKTKHLILSTSMLQVPPRVLTALREHTPVYSVWSCTYSKKNSVYASIWSNLTAEPYIGHVYHLCKLHFVCCLWSSSCVFHLSLWCSSAVSNINHHQ